MTVVGFIEPSPLGGICNFNVKTIPFVIAKSDGQAPCVK